jgi:DNA-directed RNA polymerase subunit RPC12/RpoP
MHGMTTHWREDTGMYSLSCSKCDKNLKGWVIDGYGMYIVCNDCVEGFR